MRRLHLMEIHEQTWCPAGIRNGATDCLNLLENVGQQYRYVLPLIRQALAATQSDRIVDLCSGGGGPWFSLARQLAAKEWPGQILLTDRYPSETARQLAQRYAPEQLHYVADPIDATHVPGELSGFRTLFTAFHHFAPPDALRIVQDAVDQGQGIGIFEQTRRDPFAILIMFFLPWLALLTVPFMRPFRWSRLFWTYVIPAIPYVLCVDGVISCLRTYSTAEMKQLIARVDAPGYVWQVGRVRSPVSPIGVLYLVGYPARTGS